MDFSISLKSKLKPNAPAPSAAPVPSAAETQYNAIRGCGINPHPKVTLAALTAGIDPAAFDAQPFLLLLCTMGGFSESGEPLSDDVFLFNPQCITAEGDYTAMISQLMRLTKGALPLEDLRDVLDQENAQVSIAFTLDSHAVEWTVPIAESAFDPSIMSGLAAIAAERGDGAKLASCEVEGQQLMVFLTDQDLADLAETTGMQWTVVA